nr:VRR-NUC domain-containing protein [uncultured Arsenicibacter sp.]
MGSMTSAEFLALHKRKKEPPSEMSAEDYRKKYIPKHTTLDEHGIQVALVEWFRELYPFPEYLIFAVPNGALLPYANKTDKKTGKSFQYSPLRTKLMNEGMTPGIPDLCIPVPRGVYPGLYVEMKTATGEISPSQKEMQQALVGLGYCVVVAFGLEPAKMAIGSYLSLPKSSWFASGLFSIVNDLTLRNEKES